MLLAANGQTRGTMVVSLETMPRAALEPAACTVCSAPLRDLGRRHEYHYAMCAQCGSVQLVPIPSQPELDELYRTAYHSSGHYDTDPELSRQHRWRVCRYVARRMAEQRRPDDTRVVVELGAGWGTLGLALRDEGIPYLGLEPSVAMCEHATSLGLDMRNGGLEVLESDPALAGRIWAVATMSVYEHLPNQLDVLKRTAALLPPDGLVLIQCPTASVPRLVGRVLRRLAPRHELPSLIGFFEPPWHILFPTPSSLRLQAEQCDLVLESVQASPSGRYHDRFRRWLQVLQEAVARGGHRLWGERWPLSMAHVFVLRPRPAARLQGSRG